jgi:Bacteriophage tail sheath protein
VPEYLTPGVYVEETSFRAKSIEGVSSSTTAFVGPTRKGPIAGTPELLTSFGDFERIYGGLTDLGIPLSGSQSSTNYLAHAVRVYFDNGGAMLYVARVFEAQTDGPGVASVRLTGGDANSNKSSKFETRIPGAAGNGIITAREVETPATLRAMNSAAVGTLIRLGGGKPTPGTPVKPVDGGAAKPGDGPPTKPEDAGAAATYYVKRDANSWVDSSNNALDLGGLRPGETPKGQPVNIISVNLVTNDADQQSSTFENLALDPAHPRFIGNVLGMKQTRRMDDLENWVGVSIGSAVTAFDLHTALFGPGAPNSFTLSGGNDGVEPGQSAYENALAELEQLEDISIVAAPGHSAYADFQGIQEALITHAERPRAYCIAVLDTPPQSAVSDARTVRSRIDSTYAALYHPWVIVSNPLYRPGLDNVTRELALPPSGFMCGIYARSDVERGVYKAPANEVVRDALRFESDINFAQQGVLNPLGVNCLRFFPGRGYRVWGARTASSDPEWNYVNVRRYFIYLEASIDVGTQWAVFEPNGEALWANVTQTISSFLYNEWVNGALLGTTQQEAFFVRCDRSTMTQSDLDNGRLICLVGVAAIKPAEFVIFRIGQKTADSRN